MEAFLFAVLTFPLFEIPQYPRKHNACRTYNSCACRQAVSKQIRTRTESKQCIKTTEPQHTGVTGKFIDKFIGTVNAQQRSGRCKKQLDGLSRNQQLFETTGCLQHYLRCLQQSTPKQHSTRPSSLDFLNLSFDQLLAYIVLRRVWTCNSKIL